MTNNTINNGPRELLERLAEWDQFPHKMKDALTDPRALLSAPSPAATDQARACSLEMKTHCVELYRDAPELHEVVLASEALAACAARIAGLEADRDSHQRCAIQARAELAAIKARSVVMPKGAIMVGRSELALVRNALALDCEQGRPVRGEMLAALDASIDRFDKPYAAPVPEAKVQGVVIDADDLAQFIREIDGNHKMGAGVLAEHIAARLNAAPAAPAANAGLLGRYGSLLSNSARRGQITRGSITS